MSSSSFQQMSVCSYGRRKEQIHLEVDLLGRSHGRLDVDDLDVLPLLLQKGDQEVAGEHDIALQLILAQLDVTDGHSQTEHLLHLELDGVQKGVDLLLRILAVGDHGGELTSSVETGSHQTRKLLNQSIRSEESVVLLGQLADELLVLVEVGDLIHVHAGNTLLLANLLVLIVHEDADVNVGSGGVGELEGARETLVLGRVDLLESDLKLDGLHELSLLAHHLLSVHLDLLTGGVVQNVIQGLVQNVAANLATHGQIKFIRENKKSYLIVFSWLVSKKERLNEIGNGAELLDERDEKECEF